jgi:hypothetical protein
VAHGKYPEATEWKTRLEDPVAEPIDANVVDPADVEDVFEADRELSLPPLGDLESGPQPQLRQGVIRGLDPVFVVCESCRDPLELGRSKQSAVVPSQPSEEPVRGKAGNGSAVSLARGEARAQPRVGHDHLQVGKGPIAKKQLRADAFGTSRVAEHDPSGDVFVGNELVFQVDEEARELHEQALVPPPGPEFPGVRALWSQVSGEAGAAGSRVDKLGGGRCFERTSEGSIGFEGTQVVHQ